MNYSDTQLIGTLIKLHGFKGRYVLASESVISEKIKKWESVFLQIEGLLVPFFINYISLTSDTSAIIGFEDIDTSDAAQEFVSVNIFQLSKLVGSRKKEVITDPLIGYSVIDRKVGNIGTVDQLLDYNQNLLLSIRKSKQEILIPLNEEIIVNVNHKKKEITIDAPEGLLDINE